MATNRLKESEYLYQCLDAFADAETLEEQKVHISDIIKWTRYHWAFKEEEEGIQVMLRAHQANCNAVDPNWKKLLPPEDLESR